MNILLVFILNKDSIKQNAKYDVRYKIFSEIAYYLKDKHKIYVLPCNSGTKLTDDIIKNFKLFKTDIINTIDLCISWEPCTFKDNMYKQLKCPIIYYENGHLKNSVILDPNGLIHRSHYIDKINELCEINYDSNKCQEYINLCLNNNISKRPQSTVIDIPSEIYGNYVFIPSQKHTDISLKDSKISMFDCIKRTVKLCKESNIPLVVKIHPHITGDLYNEQINLIKHIKKNVYNNVYLSTSSINFLMKNALFTISLNGSTIMDNFINSTPVLVLLRCLYSNTDAVIHKNLEEGFDILLNKKYNLSKMIDKQKKIIFWYLQNNLFIENSVEENINNLSNHLTNRL